MFSGKIIFSAETINLWNKLQAECGFLLKGGTFLIKTKKKDLTNINTNKIQ